MDKEIMVIIEVRAMVAQNMLASDDQDVAGTYSYVFPESDAKPLQADKIELGYLPDDRFTEHALDLFHAEICITELDDFDIVATVVDQAVELDSDTISALPGEQARIPG